MEKVIKKEIIVKSQEELEALPLDCEGIICINFGTKINPAIIKNKYKYEIRVINNSFVKAYDNSFVRACDNSHITAYDSSSIKAYGNSHITAYDNSYVTAYDNSYIISHYRSSIEAYNNSFVKAYDNSFVRACDNSYVTAYDNSHITAYDNSHITAHYNSSVEAYGNSSVEACDYSSIIAYDNSSIIAYDNTSIIAYDNSSIIVYNNSSIIAYDNTSVEAWGNVQIVKHSDLTEIKIKGNARIVELPKTIKEFMDFYGIEQNNKTAIFYKAVRKINGEYCADRNRNFIYEIGETKIEDNVNTDVNEYCGAGINISSLQWALEYGENWKDLAILEMEVDINDIVLPKNSNGKIRTNKVKVLREMPLEECGVHGEFLSKRRG